MRVYLASPFGFNPESRGYRERVRNALHSMGHDTVDPWDQEYEVQQGPAGPDYGSLEMELGSRNESAIDGCDAVLAVMDGMEPDSGVAAEVGYAYARGKTVHAVRCDVRDAGDFPGRPLNAQVVYFVRKSGGEIFRTVDSIIF